MMPVSSIFQNGWSVPLMFVMLVAMRTALEDWKAAGAPPVDGLGKCFQEYNWRDFQATNMLLEKKRLSESEAQL